MQDPKRLGWERAVAPRMNLAPPQWKKTCSMEEQEENWLTGHVYC